MKPAYQHFSEERLMNLIQDYNYTDRYKELHGQRPRTLWRVHTLCENLEQAQQAYAAAYNELIAELDVSIDERLRFKQLRFDKLQKWMDDNSHRYSSKRYALEAAIAVEDRNGSCKDFDGNVDAGMACWLLDIGYDKQPILEGWLAS